MGFLDDVKAEHEALKRPQNQCAVGTWLDSVDAKVADEFTQALAGPWASTVIYKVMKQHGADLSMTSVRRHRRRECRCE